MGTKRFCIKKINYDLNNLKKEFKIYIKLASFSSLKSAELMKRMPNLKVIGCYGVGYDAIDVKFAKSAGIKVSNTPEVLNDEVADTAIV